MTAIGNTCSMRTSETDRPQLLRLSDVREMTRLPTATIYELMAKDEFPKPLKVGVRGVRWLLDEIVRWIQSRPRGGPARPT